MTIFHAIILSIVEGITEFLPISSTGHVLLVSDLLRIPNTSFLTSFTIAIQLGAIVAVVVLYWRKLVTNFEIWKKIIVAFIPTAMIGFIFFTFIKQFLEHERLLLAGILIGGMVMILVEFWLKKNTSHLAFGHLDFEKGKERDDNTSSEISYRKAFTVGLFQSVAFIPGVSRSAATIIGGLLLGIPRKVIVEFSFLLAIPTMAAATGLDLIRTSPSFVVREWLLLGIGVVVSFVVALVVMRWLLKFVEKYTFIPFGIYRIMIAIALGFILFL